MYSMILAFSLPFLGQHGQVDTKKIAVRPWTVVVSKDRFTGAQTCLVKGRRVTVQDGVAVFDLGAHADTSSAAYRLDRGPARSDLASVPQGMDRAIIDRTPLDNPSNGLAAITLASLIGFGHVDIRANPNTAPVGFELKGLDAALKVEAAQGCGGPVAAK